jgi:hypothetical protein
MNWFESITSRISSFITGKPPYVLAIVPRRADRIFTSAVFSNATTDTAIQPDRVRDLLPHWRQLQQPLFEIDANKRIKETEYRMYIDFAAESNGAWSSKKKLAVVCLYRRPGDTYRPIVNLPVALARTSGSADLRFALASGALAAELKDQDRPVTDNQGIAEFTIVHPTKVISAGDRILRIEVVAEIPLLGSNGQAGTKPPVTARQTVEIKLLRNSAAADMATVYKGPTDQNSSLDIWCYQPAEPEPSHDGIKQLQEVLNEVVSRHRGIAPSPPADATHFSFVPLTGVFDAATKNALNQYLSNFRAINNNPDYPYNLGAIGPDSDFLTYVKEEYAPFDPSLAANQGAIVDRRLLIGDSLYTQPSEIDGLWELYDGVVRVLQNQVRAFAQTYLDTSTFWLHRPVHSPYLAATDTVFRCLNNNTAVKADPDQNSPPLESNGAAVEINDGECFLVVNQATGWVQIDHPAGQGWVASGKGRTVANDRGLLRTVGNQIYNHGVYGTAGQGFNQNHTQNGVAYTYGGKQTPTQWVSSLTANPHADPDQIANYSEYAVGYRFGEKKDEYDAGNMAYKEAGCDCSGFVQNSIINSFFPDTTTRIVPQALINTTWLASGGFIGNNCPARTVSAPTDQEHHWVRGADLIAGQGHIVMVAEDLPDMIASTDFKIMHECGGDSSSDTTQFRRKSVRSPFSWYKNSLTGLMIGKVYIWR